MFEPYEKEPLLTCTSPQLANHFARCSWIVKASSGGQGRQITLQMCKRTAGHTSLGTLPTYAISKARCFKGLGCWPKEINSETRDPLEAKQTADLNFTEY